MSVLQEIYNWSQELPPWQRDALRRLLNKPKLDASDLDDLCALLKAEHGIADSKGRTARPLTAEQIPVPANTREQVKLLAIKNLRHVNALAESQTLTIGSLGMTVVYGDNGSGKSGYSRVLKRACRARDCSEPILPNITDVAAKGAAPEGDFELMCGTRTTVRHWVNGAPAAEELSTIAVFDGCCARAYLDSEGDFSYVPYGLDLLGGLVSLCDSLKAMIQTEQVGLVPQTPILVGLKAHTKVGTLLAKLSENTSAAEIERLATLPSVEVARHGALDASLKENDPKEKLTQLKLRIGRVSAIAQQLREKLKPVAAEAVNEWVGLVTRRDCAEEAALAARAEFGNGECLLPGTGGESWRLLFDAARKFADESDLACEFPDLGEDDRCPLCQQPLGEGAARLARFERFVQRDTERNAKFCRDAVTARLELLAAQDLNLHLDEARLEELELLHPGLASALHSFQEILNTRRADIVAAADTGDFEKLGKAEFSLEEVLSSLIKSLTEEAEVLAKVADLSSRSAAQAEFDELDARLKLSEGKSAVLGALERHQRHAGLKKCLSAVRTNAISKKSAQLVNERVCGELRDRLNQEFEVLGVGNLAVELKSRPEKGRVLHKLTLKPDHGRGPTEVLSEGEQRAIAIASFLAEVGLGGGNGGIVFDDPVSSLDHRRRERVARRLVAEGANRQVVIFTHDIYFLRRLEDECKVRAIPIHVQSLARCQEGFGVPSCELPFEGRNTKTRVGALKSAAQELRALHRRGADTEYRQKTLEVYSQLRMSWERAVEEVLFQQVVLRFRKSVETQRLKGVAVEDDDYKQIDAAMAKCSNYAAHDRADAVGIAAPDPDELEQDIGALESWLKSVSARADSTAKRRKAN